MELTNFLGIPLCDVFKLFMTLTFERYGTALVFFISRKFKFKANFPPFLKPFIL